MGESSIFTVGVTTFFGAGVGIRKYDYWEFSLSLPFIYFSVEFKKKTPSNDWFSFSPL